MKKSNLITRKRTQFKLSRIVSIKKNFIKFSFLWVTTATSLKAGRPHFRTNFDSQMWAAHDMGGHIPPAQG